MDVIVAAAADTADGHADAIVCAENFASEREGSCAYRDGFAGGLQKVTPLDFHDCRLLLSALLQGALYIQRGECAYYVKWVCGEKEAVGGYAQRLGLGRQRMRGRVGGLQHQRKKGAVKTMRVSGTFEVKLNVQKADNKEEESAKLGRMSIEKQFHGDLEGTSAGEMLSVGTEVKGSAGYVAMERVSGTLHGRAGTFALQHSGTMTRGEPQLSVTVVPDSGTGELVGIVGKMMIKIVEKKHFYEFEYTLPEIV